MRCGVIFARLMLTVQGERHLWRQCKFGLNLVELLGRDGLTLPVILSRKKLFNKTCTDLHLSAPHFSLVLLLGGMRNFSENYWKLLLLYARNRPYDLHLSPFNIATNCSQWREMSDFYMWIIAICESYVHVCIRQLCIIRWQIITLRK